MKISIARPRRHGEPHQRAVCAVCRSGERRQHARQPVAPVSVRHGLFVGVRATPPGTASHALGPRASRHDSSAAAEDWRPDSSDSTQELGTDVQQLSAANPLPSGASTTPLLKLMPALRATRSLTTPRSSPQSGGRSVPFLSVLQLSPTRPCHFVPHSRTFLLFMRYAG